MTTVTKKEKRELWWKSGMKRIKSLKTSVDVYDPYMDHTFTCVYTIWEGN